MRVTTLKGIFPDPEPLRKKNFIHENVKNLRRMERCFQANKDVEELHKLQIHKTVDKYQNISAKVITNLREKKKHQNDNTDTILKNNINLVLTDKIENKEQKSQDKIDILEPNIKHVVASKKIITTGINGKISGKQRKQGQTSKYNEKYSQQKVQPKILFEPNVMHKFDNAVNNINIQNIIKYKSQGIQTLDIDQIESIYAEGIIRYPSEKITKHDGTVNDANLNQQKEKALKLQSNFPADRGDMHISEDLRKLDLRNAASPIHRGKDFIKLNKENTSVANKLAMQLNSDSPLKHYRKGVVPKYLREKKEIQQKEQEAKIEVSYPDCPKGHVPLPDHERKETLQLLKKNYQEYVNKLNLMPIKADTLRAQRHKMEIEKQLNKLEEGIKVFSRPKVYVKINA
ncbi:uncharacterized protein LOC105190758 [Harpegnathos saltator]|uniref:uncharacterized protein LOC105190758 n=1 Tax=Harpegnathos saltator TaxID=610380 RepID=UPI00058B55D6|nr:uncharacterized protein LOC105190758 [Harpegnathos saltator]